MMTKETLSEEKININNKGKRGNKGVSLSRNLNSFKRFLQ